MEHIWLRMESVSDNAQSHSTLSFSLEAARNVLIFAGNAPNMAALTATKPTFYTKANAWLNAHLRLSLLFFPVAVYLVPRIVKNVLPNHNALSVYLFLLSTFNLLTVLALFLARVISILLLVISPATLNATLALILRAHVPAASTPIITINISV